eukprot:Clim_evm28s152 gene=Clim_evmTU28s152
MGLSLVGKTAIVTGATGGIGQAVCRALVSCGASTVYAADLKATGSDVFGGASAIRLHDLDVGSEESVKQIFDRACSEHDGVPPSIIINGAGITRDALLVRQSVKSWDDVMDVNAKGTWLMMRELARLLDTRLKDKALGDEERAIVNISSIVAKMGNIGQANYSASKGAVISMTKTVAREMGRVNTRVNCILPGFIKTPMTDVVPEKVMNQMLAAVPLGRIGQPGDIASACTFLSSKQAGYITGTTLEVTGGLGM